MLARLAIILYTAFMETQEVKENTTKTDPEMKIMLEAGVHFGHKKARQNPKMSQYIFGVRNSISIIDLEKTRDMLSVAVEYMSSAVNNGKIILFVDTKPATREDTRAVAVELGMPYVTERWPGGTLTNWKTITDRIEYLKDLEAGRKSEEWGKYTKKERSGKEEEIVKLNMLWGGIKDMSKLPDILFVVDIIKNEIAVREANIKDIPIVAIVDTNVDPTVISYPIPANDDAISSVKYVLSHLRDAIIKGKPRRKAGVTTRLAEAPAKRAEASGKSKKTAKK